MVGRMEPYKRQEKVTMRDDLNVYEQSRRLKKK